jgi:hypothetical protein
MKKLFLVFALALAVGLATANASDWTYSFTSTNISGSGSMTADPSGVGAYPYLATTAAGSITSGTYNGAALSLIAGGPGVTLSPQGAFNYDDLFSYPPSNPGVYVDTYGLLFAFSQGGNNYELNVYGTGPDSLGHNYSVWAHTGTYPGGAFNPVDTGVAAFAVSPSPVPEPGFYGVLALGLSGLFVGVRRRRRT